MPARYTKNDVRNSVTSLAAIAKTVGVLPVDAKLVYSPGSLTNGISSTIEAVMVQENGHRNAVRVRFLPEFTYKTSMREQVRLLDAVTTALYSVAMKDTAE